MPEVRYRKPIMQEMWLAVPGFQYLVGDRGHIKRRRGKRPVVSRLDIDGYTQVLLQRGKTETWYQLDSLIAGIFTGRRLSHARPIHLDGLPWNCWACNLDWGITSDLENGDNLVTAWTVRTDGKLQHGPFDDKRAALQAARQGDTIVGRNSRNQIISYEIKFSANAAVAPRSPLDLAQQYTVEAHTHNNQFWSVMLAEAAMVIRQLADEHLAYLTAGNPAQVALQGEAFAEPVVPATSNGEAAEAWPIEARRPRARRALPEAPVTPEAPAKRQRRALG